MDAIQRKIPFSVEAEQSVLGAILINPNCFLEVSQILSSEDFYIENHQRIFDIMSSYNLQGKPIDVIVLINELVKQNVFEDEVGARSYVKVIAEVVPGSQNVKDYANLVKDKSTLRKLISACEEIEQVSYTENEDVKTIVDFAEKKIFDISKNNDRHDFVHIREVIVRTYERLKTLKDNATEDALGIKSGFSELDRTLIGFEKGDLIIVGARPGVGKTSFCLNIGASVAKRTKKAVCIFSLEMSDEQLVARIISSEAMVDLQKLRTGNLDSDDWEKLAVASSILSETDIYIDDTTGISITGMKAKLRRIKNLGLVVVDYLQLMQPERRTSQESRVNQIGEISRNLKILAKELGVPVIACSQLSRGTEKQNQKPMLSDLRDSGSIEQDADMVIFLSRDYYGIDPEKQNVVEVSIAKNRHGNTGNITMSWLGQYTKFSTLDTAQETGDEEENS